MDIERLKIAEEVVKTAEELIFAAAGGNPKDYIYDPDHKKHPGGGYHKTEKGWSKGKEEKDGNGDSGNKSESKKNEEKSNSNKETSKKQTVKRQDIEEKLKSFSTNKINQMSQDVNAPNLLLDILSSNEYVNVRNNVAQNKNTNAKTLDKLSNDDSFIVKCSVARNANTSKETLDKLSNDKSEYVRIAVASNENTPVKTLDKLSKDKNIDVRWWVAHNENASHETLTKLLDDENSQISSMANETIFHKKQKEKQKQAPAAPPAPPEPPKPPKTPSTSGMGKSNKDTMTKEQLEKGLKKLPPKKLADIAKSNTTERVLDILSKHEDAEVKHQVALNKNTSTETLDKMAESTSVDNHSVISALVNNNKLSATGVFAIADKYEQEDSCPVANEIVNHKSMGRKDLVELFEKSSNLDIKAAVCGSKKTPSSFLKKQIDEYYEDNPMCEIAFETFKKKKGFIQENHPAGKAHKITFTKNSITKKAVQAQTEGTIKSPEGEEHYNAGDYIAEDGNGGQYIIPKDEFGKLYDATSDPTVWKSKPTQVTMFKTNKALTIKSPWGDLKADVGDWVQLKDDGSLGAPRKPYVIDTDYTPNIKTTAKYKFKGDDKTAPIIRAKFEKGQDEEETDAIYGEMAKFSRDDVAPMGVYHGRSKDQLKADFIKNMNPANYSSPEAFQNAKKRIQALSANDFSRILASIFADEEEEV